MKKLLLVLTVVAMASFLLVGCLPTTNIAPVITSSPGLTATIGTEYSYTVIATDADDDTLTYSVSPSDLAIAANVITWTPTAVGTMDVIVTVTDGTDPVTQSFTITVSEAPVVNTVPVITAIANQTTTLGELFTYTVVATDAEGDTLTYSLTDCPLLMEISAAGVITYTPEFATQLGPHAVVVEVSDGELVATKDFVLTVVELVVDPLVIDIDVPDAYVHPTKGPIVAADCYDVVVTFSDNSITEGQDVWARWSDVVGAVDGPWVLLDANADYTVFTEELCFTTAITECIPICIEVKVGTICCDPIIYSEMITVDYTEPCASFTVCVDDCGPCDEGAEMSWVTTCEDVCGIPFDCCDDNCSGVADWTFVLDDDVCDGPCDTEPGIDCPINGAFECGCLLYSEDEEVPVDHEVEVTIADNVGNTFTSTWTLTFDTDELTGFVASGATVTTIDGACDWDYYLDYGCEWDDCDECEPEEED